MQGGELMAVFRVNKTTDYTVMSNSHLKNNQMSLKAKGLLSLMLSLPDDWDYSINGLVALSNDKRTAVMSALEELKKNEYVVIDKKRNDKGQFENVYNIFEEQQTNRCRLSDAENPMRKTRCGLSDAENQQQLNTNKSNTKELNTKQSNTEQYKYIVEYLNQKASTNYRSTIVKTKSLIDARLNEGFTIADFEKVIDNKVAEWKGSDYEKYLRPETLFSNKFESYLNQKPKIESVSY